MDRMGTRAGTETRRRVVVALVAAIAIGGLVACEPLPPPEPGSTLIGCDRAGSRVTLTETSHLDPTCEYAGIDITSSGITLDCQGAWIRSAPGAGGRGILVEAPEGVTLTDVTVRNCNVEGFLNSLRVTRAGFRTLAEGEEYEHTTARILVEDSDFTRSRGVGIFVDGYVSDVTLRDNNVSHTGSTGIYLETGSRRSHVIGNSLGGERLPRERPRRPGLRALRDDVLVLGRRARGDLGRRVLRERDRGQQVPRQLRRRHLPLQELR